MIFENREMKDGENTLDDDQEVRCVLSESS